MENVRVRRAGYANRQTYEHFLQRYKMLCPQTWPNFTSGTVKKGCKLILEAFNLRLAPSENHDVALGTTKLFIRQPRTLAFLESARTDRIPDLVIKVQSRWRAWIARRFVRRLRAAVTIKRAFKKFKLRFFFVKVLRLFDDVENDPNLGRDLVWPRPPAVLHEFINRLKFVHQRWRARKVISRCAARGRAMGEVEGKGGVCRTCLKTIRGTDLVCFFFGQGLTCRLLMSSVC